MFKIKCFVNKHKRPNALLNLQTGARCIFPLHGGFVKRNLEELYNVKKATRDI